MKARTKRVPTRVHTRKLDRSVAHALMKKGGLVGVNDHSHGIRSFFAEHWRESQNR